MKKLLFYSLLSLSLFAVPSCGSDKEDEPIIAVTGLNLDYTSITIEEGDTFTLTATVLPDNATDKTVLWTTGDASVATVSDGIVSALKGGVSWITAKAGDKIARCKVTVKPLNLYVAKAFSVSEPSKYFFPPAICSIIAKTRNGYLLHCNMTAKVMTMKTSLMVMTAISIYSAGVQATILLL